VLAKSGDLAERLYFYPILNPCQLASRLSKEKGFWCSKADSAKRGQVELHFLNSFIIFY